MLEGCDIHAERRLTGAGPTPAMVQAMRVRDPAEERAPPENGRHPEAAVRHSVVRQDVGRDIRDDPDPDARADGTAPHDE